ncbi:sigma-70 family RNA polymerase sigma factor [Thermoleophilia bacterium SCSIO 60948]|nr:sigma-70 family RNA polymerase sigma factor [Thermoleophilia bacterium SCSIO 60948]
MATRADTPGEGEWGDPELLERLAERDEDALRRVYERVGAPVFALLLRTLDERSDAEDVLQQVMLELWQRAPSYDPSRGTLVTWAMNIARSRAIDLLRRRVPEPIGAGTDPELERRLGAIDDDPVERMVERHRVAGLLRGLPAVEREVLRLRFYEGLSQREIAARLDAPLGTVKMRMVSGLRRLREAIEEDA